ncbi:hypothetical protein COF61_05510 [Bacillus toyonensis]|nr:hypothetical protein COF61_05510 [Bacillus toyonensis]
MYLNCVKMYNFLFLVWRPHAHQLKKLNTPKRENWHPQNIKIYNFFVLGMLQNISLIAMEFVHMDNKQTDFSF